MEWNDGYSVGDFDLDHQHQQLFKMVNALYAAMQQGQGRTVLEPLLLDLVHYTEKHFQDEERAMAQAAYPELTTHHEVHEKLTSQVAEIAARFQSGEAGMTLEVMKFLEDWLKRHILGMDKKYGPYLHEDHEGGKKRISNIEH